MAKPLRNLAQTTRFLSEVTNHKTLGIGLLHQRPMPIFFITYEVTRSDIGLRNQLTAHHSPTF
jgi:hypothetical protein